MNDDYHVYPTGDLKEHVLAPDCWCNPDLDEEYHVYIHNSMDGREKYETGERLPH